MNLKKTLKLSLILLVLVLTSLNFVMADSIDIKAGHSYYVELDSSMGSFYWGGIEIISNGISLTESRFPITVPISMATPVIWKPGFPGINFADDHHYYAAMFPSQFDLNLVRDMSFSDLQPEGLFSSSQFPLFYPDYLSKTDSPDKTFTEQSTVTIGGKNFTSYRTMVQNNIYVHVVKYEESPGVFTPLFMVKLEPAICFSGSSCLGEFLLPVSSRNYNFYALSDLPQYSYRIWIDGIETVYFPQTGIPHEVTFELTNILTDTVEEDVRVFVAEDDGQNLFLPYRLSGYVTETYSVGSTDVSGLETFIVTPTKYGEIPDYSIHYGVFFGSAITSPGELNITSSDTLIQQKKSFTQPGLSNNLKVAVNGMNSISDYLYRWADSNTALDWQLNYDIGSGIFTEYDSGVLGPITLKTGAVNVIDFNIKNGASNVAGYSVKLKESDGYLIMNPYTGSSPLTQKERFHYQQVPAPTQLIITPTTYNDVSSTITVEILNPSNTVVGTHTFSINSNLEDPSGTFYSSNLLKTISVAMKQILSSVYYSLN